MPDAENSVAPSGRLSSVLFWIAALAIVAGGFWLRDKNYTEPYFHPDEQITTGVVGYMRQSGDLDTNWIKADLTADQRYDQYNFSSHLYATYLFYRVAKLVPGNDAWRSPRKGILVYRLFSVLLATIAIAQAMQLGLRIGGRAVAVGAGVLTAVAVLLVQDAHYARPEPFVTVLTLAVVALCWPTASPLGRRIGMIAASLLIGVLVACKVSMLMLAWLPLVPLVKAWHNDTVRARALMLAGICLGVIAGFALGVPGAIAHPSIFVHGVAVLMKQYSGLHPPHSHIDGGMVGDFLALYFAGTLGWLSLACASVGATMLILRRRWAESALLTAPVLLFLGYFSTRTVFFERNLSHVVPLLLALAAFGAVEVAGFAASRLRLPAVAIAAGLIVLMSGKSVMMSVPLVTFEFPGRGAVARDRVDAELRRSNPDAAWHAEALIDGTVTGWLATHFRETPQKVLLRVHDFNDEWSASTLAKLDAQFDMQLVKDRPSIFAGLPVCTLLTYHSVHDRYYLVRGAKPSVK